jgi:hypothetical protein
MRSVPVIHKGLALNEDEVPQVIHILFDSDTDPDNRVVALHEAPEVHVVH